MAGGFLCATVAAPLDYGDSSGQRIKLAVVEHPATGSMPHGVIFVNPGGPGGQGTVQIPQWIGLFPKTLLRDYDIVSWDPRGVGASTAVQCFANQGAESAFLGRYALFPTGRRQERAYINRWREFGRICAQRGGALLRNVSTADTARDLNLLREDLGQAKLNYLGVSYGTYLGATYANLFPREVGRMVLDGNTAPEAVANHGRPNAALSLSLRLGQDRSVTEVLAAFLRLCGQRDTRACAFSAGGPAATKSKWDSLLARLKRAPISLGGAAYTYADVLNDASASLDFVQPYTSPVAGGSWSGWAGLADGLQQLWTARADEATANQATSPVAQRYAGAEQAYATLCDDSPSPPASAYPRLQRLMLRTAGVIGLQYLWEQDEPCGSWPIHQVNAYSGPWDARTSAILVVNNTHDPATTLSNAVAMTHELADARLLVVNGYGHTAFLNPSTCANNYMTAYFLTGVLPPRGAVCSQNLRPFASPAPGDASLPRHRRGAPLSLG